jgi:hypothetical protein
MTSPAVATPHPVAQRGAPLRSHRLDRVGGIGLIRPADAGAWPDANRCAGFLFPGDPGLAMAGRAGSPAILSVLLPQAQGHPHRADGPLQLWASTGNRSGRSCIRARHLPSPRPGRPELTDATPSGDSVGLPRSSLGRPAADSSAGTGRLDSFAPSALLVGLVGRSDQPGELLKPVLAEHLPEPGIRLGRGVSPGHEPSSVTLADLQGLRESTPARPEAGHEPARSAGANATPGARRSVRRPLPRPREQTRSLRNTHRHSIAH